MKTDIRYRDDIDLLVSNFYQKAVNDELLQVYFSEFDYSKRRLFISKMTDFWENLCLFTGDYNGNPMEVHTMLHGKNPMTLLHFKRWEELFGQTVDQLFEGVKAETIKAEACKISKIIQDKLFK